MALTIYKDWRDFPMDQWRWPSFKPWEVACKDGGKGREGIPKTLAIDEYSMDCLQRLRDIMGAPIQVTSAYRTPAYNKRIGGAVGSKHKEAIAYDIIWLGHDPAKLYAAGMKAGFTSFGFYETSGFIHMDTRNGLARWGDKWFEPYTGDFGKPAVNPKPLTKSRTMGGGTVAGAGGAAIVIKELGVVSDAVKEQKESLLSGDTLTLVLAGIIIFGAITAIYARWDDAGRPKFWSKK